MIMEGVNNNSFQCLLYLKIELSLWWSGVRFVGPSGVHVLPLGVAAEQSVHYFGPSGVCALPLGVGAKRSVHYICDYCSFSVLSFSATYFSPRRVYCRVPKFCMGF